MPKHKETRILPWTAAQMFDLVADVGRYSEFLPWISQVRVRSDSEHEMVADLIIGFKGLRESFTSRVTKSRPKALKVDYVDGPLKFLYNEWTFNDLETGGCTVEFTVDFAFKSKLFEALAGQVFDRALRKMIDAFIARAAALYGAPSVSGISKSSATNAA
jgi:coenzyme Q-binding protein COQ10